MDPSIKQPGFHGGSLGSSFTGWAAKSHWFHEWCGGASDGPTNNGWVGGSRWWFQTFGVLIPTGANDPIWLYNIFQMGWNSLLRFSSFKLIYSGTLIHNNAPPPQESRASLGYVHNMAPPPLVHSEQDSCFARTCHTTLGDYEIAQYFGLPSLRSLNTQ